MPRMTFEQFGRGLNTNGARGPDGHSRVSRNMHHNKGTARAILREGTMRVWATKTEAPTWNIFEFANASGTVFRLCKVNDELETFSLTAATAKTDLGLAMSTAGRADFATTQGLAFIADQKAAFYVTNGATVKAVGRAAPSSALSPTETSAAAASGFGVGTYRCAYSFYNPTFDMESIPRAYESVTKANANTGIRVTTPTDPADGYTTMYFYRTRVGEVGPYFRAGSSTTFGSTFDYTVLDADLGFAATPYSTVHNADGEIVTVIPDSPKFTAMHKEYLHAYASTSKALRDSWSDLSKPCQFTTSSIAQNPASYHDVEPGQGRIATGLNSFNGSLVYFKDYSITVKNGDIDPSTWVWNVVVDGIGCVAPWTRALAPNIGIFFCGHDGIYLFDLNSVTKISDKPNGVGIGEDYRNLKFSLVENWWGVWNETTREYWIGVTTSSATTYPDRVYCYAFDTGAWSTLEFGMGLLLPTCAGVVTNSSSVKRVYVGLSDGHALETGLIATKRDGPISGTVTGVCTTPSDEFRVEDSGASFYSTGNGLVGLVVTVRYSATNYVSRVIAGSSGTALSVADAWPSDNTGKTYFIGAVRGTLAVEQWDADDAGPKHYHAINGTWAKQSHSIPVRVGFTLDDDSIPTYHGTEFDCKDIRFSSPVGDRGTQIGPYIDIIGTDCDLEVTLLEVDHDSMDTRRPGN